MKKYCVFAVAVILLCLDDANASSVCQNEILEAARSGDSVKALICLSEKIDEINNKYEGRSIQANTATPINRTNYDPKKPPFALRLNRSVLVCDDRFSIAYTGYVENVKKFEFKINGSKKTGHPGDQFFERVGTSGGGLAQVTVRFLEYIKDEDAPLITYKCTDLR
jgi:hypothetical protein